MLPCIVMKHTTHYPIISFIFKKKIDLKVTQVYKSYSYTMTDSIIDGTQINTNVFSKHRVTQVEETAINLAASRLV
jgi:hypothetical protein